MFSIFSPDSKFMTAMDRVCDLLFLNILFLLTSLPVVTIGAASTALYTVCFRFDTEKETGVFKGYFRAFRENFRQSTVLWLVIGLFGVTSALNVLLFRGMTGVLHYLFVPCGILLVVAVLMGSCLFPLLSQFSNDGRTALKNAFFLSVGYLPRFLLISAINILPLAMLLLDPYLFFQTGIVWILIYFSAGAYINSLILKKVFAPYLGEEEA